MKKLNVVSYVKRTKWAVLLLAIAFLFLFGRVVKSPALTKTAIVVGTGVDFDEQTKEFEVTTQTIIMASSASESSAQTTYETYTDRGKTISGALDRISRKIGLTVSLAHCEVLFLSRTALKLDHLQLIYPLTLMYALREQAIIVTGDKTPREMLAVRIGSTVSAPFFLQSALANSEGTDGLIKTTAKDMLASSMSRSQATAIPYITAVKMQDQPMDQQGELKDNFEFDLSRTLAFDHDKSIVLDEELSEILAIYLSNDTRGSLNYTAKNGGTVEFKILDKSVKTTAKGKNVSAKIELSVNLLDIQFLSDGKVVTGADSLVKEAANALAKELTDKLNRLMRTALESDIDFLGVQAKAYQSVGRDLPEHCLDKLTFTPSVKLTVKEAA